MGLGPGWLRFGNFCPLAPCTGHAAKLKNIWSENQLENSWSEIWSRECRKGTKKCVESKWNHAAVQLASWKEGVQPLFPKSEGWGISAPLRDPQSRSSFHSPGSIGQWELVLIGSSWVGSSAHTIPGTEQVICYNTCQEACPSLCR